MIVKTSKAILFVALLLILSMAKAQNSPPQLPGHGQVNNFTPAIPQHVLIENIIVASGDTLCFNAWQSITVQDVFVNQTGSITLIAGESIVILPGTVVQSDAHFHAYISDVFCTNPTPLAGNEEEIVLIEEPIHATGNSDFFKISPNPTSGNFKLVLTDPDFVHYILVEIYNLMGEKILHKQITGSEQFIFDISAIPPGIYLLRADDGRKQGIKKLIKN
jgi:hypothetical protein